MADLLCQNCGVAFVGPPNKKSCNKKCREAYRRKTQPEWYRAYRNRHASNMKRRISVYRKNARLNSPWQMLLYVAAARAKEKNLKYDITQEWARTRWTGKCELTNIPFQLGRTRRNLFSPSLDKIDPQGGYTKDNCRFILWAVNMMKEKGTDEDVLFIAKALILKNPQ